MAEVGEAPNSEAKASGGMSMNMSFFKKPSKVYIVEFLIMHVGLLGIYIAGSNLFNKLIDETKEEVFANSFSLYEAAFGIEFTLGMVAYAIVSTVLFLWLYSRVSRSEVLSPDLAKSRRRRLLQYIFLTIVALAVFSNVISVVYTLLVKMFADGAINENIDLWRDLVKQAFGIGLGSVLLYFVASNVDPNNKGGK